MNYEGGARTEGVAVFMTRYVGVLRGQLRLLFVSTAIVRFAASKGKLNSQRPKTCKKAVCFAVTGYEVADKHSDVRLLRRMLVRPACSVSNMQCAVCSALQHDFVNETVDYCKTAPERREKLGD